MKITNGFSIMQTTYLRQHKTQIMKKVFIIYTTAIVP